MGKNKTIWGAPTGPRRTPTRCMGHCGRPVVYGDRCPDCARELRQRHKRKRR